MWIAVAGIACLYVGSTLPTPLYPLYRQQFGFSEFIVTAIYASYVIGNLTALFALGRVSDQLGRRPTTLVAFGVLFASILCFLGSTGIGVAIHRASPERARGRAGRGGADRLDRRTRARS
jgi:MFS family permease